MRGSEEIVKSDIRQSAITSQSIGVHELELLLDAVPEGSDQESFERAIIQENVLGLKTTTSREWRFQTLRRLYQLTPRSVLFRALRELWIGDPDSHPLLACLSALSQDTIFRATASLIIELPFGATAAYRDFTEPIENHFPGAYKQTTIETIAKKAYASWGQTGHLSEAEKGLRVRTQARCQAENVAYALMLGYLEGARGEALFETLWAQILDHPKSQLYELAFSASQRGMLEYRNAGGVVEVGFRDLLRPMEGELL